MNIQIFGASKSFDTKKAERWFKERRIKFQAIDVRKYGMSRGELSSVRHAVGLEAMIDPKHPDYTLLEYLASDQAKLDKLYEDPTLLNLPHCPQRKTGHCGLLPANLGILVLTGPVSHRLSDFSSPALTGGFGVSVCTAPKHCRPPFPRRERRSPMKRILIVDSDMAVRGQIGRHARLEGYEVAEAGDGYTAVSMCRQNAFDIIILAILLPEMDGFSVCQTIRSFSQVPILMLTERTSEQDRIHGLELGADDYMTKPFSPRELMLRISAILKRGKSLDSLEPQSIERDGIYIDLTARRVHVDGTLVSLTPKEFDLLALLASHPDVVFSRKKLLDTVWGGELPEDTRTLDTHIKQVRHAISPYSDRIVTLRGVGYRFEKT